MHFGGASGDRSGVEVDHFATSTAEEAKAPPTILSCLRFNGDMGRVEARGLTQNVNDFLRANWSERGATAGGMDRSAVTTSR